MRDAQFRSTRCLRNYEASVGAVQMQNVLIDSSSDGPRGGCGANVPLQVSLGSTAQSPRVHEDLCDHASVTTMSCPLTVASYVSPLGLLVVRTTHTSV